MLSLKLVDFFFLVSNGQNILFTPANPTFPNLSANQTLNFTSAPVTGLIGRIAFISDNGTVNLSVMNADTTSEINLVDTDPGGCSSDESAPSWSPDGSRIAFSRCETTFSDLFTIRPDSTGLTRITNQPLFDLFPSWSPNGTKITYTYGECSGTDVLVPEIFATDLTGNTTKLTNNGILDAILGLVSKRFQDCLFKGQHSQLQLCRSGFHGPVHNELHRRKRGPDYEYEPG